MADCAGDEGLATTGQTEVRDVVAYPEDLVVPSRNMTERAAESQEASLADLNKLGLRTKAG